MIKKMNNLEKHSRKLAYILRHGKKSLPEMEIGGWLSISYLIEKKGFTAEKIETLVNTDAKHRFEYSKSGKMIRALYGHSLNVELNLIPSEPSMFLWHVSATVALASLTKERYPSLIPPICESYQQHRICKECRGTTWRP